MTIGITSYNSIGSLPNALESALWQDWPNLEVVVVDDCSTDGSFALLEAWASQDPVRRHIFVQPKNGGVAQARNRIITEAKGAFICFFDDDDTSAIDRVSRQVDRIQQYEKEFAKGALVICHTACRQRYPNGSTQILKTMGCRTGRIAPHGTNVARRVLLGAPVNDAYGSMPTCSQMARARTYDLIGGFDGNLRRSEDTDLVIRLALAGAHFVGIDAPLVEQTMTPTNEKSIMIEQSFSMLVLNKHRAFIDCYGNFSFELGWTEIKHLWFLRRRVAFLVAIFGLLVRHPRRTMWRLYIALPHLSINRATRMFRDQVPSPPK